ncbi:MAG: ribonuclease III [Gammaproteobacteria bacterium]|nr:ribonuclease III [Gammaproteobacteria bacterium]
MSEGKTGPAAGFGHQFKNGALLDIALTHRSAAGANNERLEYLGDAILNFVIADTLYQAIPRASEGVLTRRRASLVKRETLAAVAREWDIGEWIKLGGGERKSGGWRRDSILANTLEALLGAIYLDAGLPACRDAILRIFASRLEGQPVASPDKDPKTTLQELLQARRLPLPIYRIIAEEGEAHQRIFRVECRVTGLDGPVIGRGRSKRSAEQAAAVVALERLTAESV